MTIEKAEYICKYYSNLLTPNQKTILYKLFDVSNYLHFLNLEPNDKSLNEFLLDRYGLAKSNVVLYHPDKRNDFIISIATEILDANKSIINFNTCPVCGELARTPHAKQAKCGHRWQYFNVSCW